MKKSALLLVCFALSQSVSVSAQVQNLDFEQWDFPVTFADPALNRPTGWVCSNRWFGFEEAAYSERMVRPVDADAQSDQYALSLFTYYNYMKDAAVQTAAIDYRPSSLKGFFKYRENFIIWGVANYTDTAQVVVELTKWDPVLSKHEIVGKGKFKAYQETNAFTSFEAIIEYTSAAQPDSITILLDPSVLGRYPGMDLQNEAHGGRSVFTVDRLELTAEGTATIKEMNKNKTLVLSPNPAVDNISFETMSGEVVVMDVAGKVVLNVHMEDASSLDISLLNKGMFTFQIRNESGIHTSRFVKL
jgi:hypothetical protein